MDCLKLRSTAGSAYQAEQKRLRVRLAHGSHTLLNNCTEQAAEERSILVNSAHGCKLSKMEMREIKVLP